MKDTRKTFTRLLVALSLAIACLAANARAQNREEHFISARAGGINFVSGDVTAQRAGEKDWQRLSVKDDLKSGDTVRAGGRVEVLLNPGSYLRAGDGAEFELTSASLDDLQLKLIRGGVVIEATGYDGLELSIVVVTPQTRVRIVRSGLYHLSALPSGMTEVAVQKGRAILGGTPETLVKGGKVARVGAGGVEIVKFDKENRDALDFWSRERGQELAKANEKLANRSTNALLARASFDNMFSAQNTSGLWLWSVRSRCYTFLPFYAGYQSPYGLWYGSWYYPFSYASCDSCRHYPRQPGNNTPYPSPTTTHNPPGGGTYPSGGTPTGGSPMPPPTLTRMPTPPPPTMDRGDRFGGRGRTTETGSRPLDH